MTTPYVFRIDGSVLPTVIGKVIGIGLFTALVCVVSAFTRIRLDISPILITTMGFIVGLTLSFRTTTAYNRWWEARIAWDRLTATSRNLARFIWISVPEKECSRDILLKKSAINLIAVFAVALKNHLRDQRGHDVPDIAPMIPHLATYSKTKYDGGILPMRLRRNDTIANCGFTMQNDWCEATLQAGVLPTELCFHLSSYMEFIRAEHPGLPNYLPQNFNLLLNTMSEIVSTCERIRRTPIPIAYNIVIAQILWIYCLSLPFQLIGVLSWASIPLCMIASAFLFSLQGIGTEIEDPFGKDANDLNLELYCKAIRTELDVLTSIPPPKVDTWAVQDGNRPLWGASGLSFKELEAVPVDEVRRLLSRKGQVEVAPASLAVTNLVDV